MLGLETLPSPGDSFQSVADPAKARQIAMFRQARAKEKLLVAKGSRLTLETLQQQMAEGGVKDLPIIVKADVQGSAEVLASSLAKLSDDKVKVKVIHSAVGAINESDVLLATASNAIIIGFNVRPDRNAADVAEREKVDIRHHSVIYTVTEEIQKAMVGMLEPTFKEVRLGSAQVRDTFKVPKAGTIAGCMVLDGRITRQGDAQVRLLRDNVVVWEGKLASLRRFKDDVSEVKAGMECGIGLQNYNDVKVGDIIEVFQMERVAALGVGAPAAGNGIVAIVLLTVDFHFPFAQSLKDKRMILRGVKDRAKKFNVSVAEVDHHDLWQRATLAVVAVATDGAHAERELQAVVDGDRTPRARADYAHGDRNTWHRAFDLRTYGTASG